MASQRDDCDRNEFESYRISGLIRTAHTITAILNAGGIEANAKDIFDQLNGEEPFIDEDNPDEDEGSLAELKRQRREREKADSEKN